MAAIRERAVTTLPKLIRCLRVETTGKALREAGGVGLPSLRRAFSLYDQINLIDNVPQDQLRFQGYTDTRFKVNRVDYEVLRPVPEILILGNGREIQPVNPELRQFIQSTGMKLEAIDSRNAASTYNILNEEGRIVAAALIPYGVCS